MSCSTGRPDLGRYQPWEAVTRILVEGQRPDRVMSGGASGAGATRTPASAQPR